MVITQSLLHPIVKRRVFKRRPKTKKEIIEMSKEEWERIDPKIVENMIKSMPRRIKRVISKNGYPICY